MNTQMIESQPPVSLHGLRDAIEKARRQITSLDASNIEEFLLLLDQLEGMFLEFEEAKDAVRSEETHWMTIQDRISAEPELVVAPATKAGGLAALRAKHPPAEGFWWHLDTVTAGQRRGTLRRNALIVGAILLVVVLVWGGMNYFARNNTETVSLNEANASIEQLVQDQQWSEALAVVESARESSPDDINLLVWEAVLSEQTDDARSMSILDEGQQMMADEPTEFWLLVGNTRLQVGNLDGAEEVAQEALMISPEDAQVTFLLGRIAEARGDIPQAVDYYNQTMDLAGETNPELSALVKVRMGYMTQRVDPLPGASSTDGVTKTLTP